MDIFFRTEIYFSFTKPFTLVVTNKEIETNMSSCTKTFTLKHEIFVEESSLKWRQTYNS